MTAAAYAALLVGAFAVAAALTAVLRTYAVRRSLIDRPNSRSTHSVDTPRGGGAAIVFAFTAGLVLLSSSGSLPRAVTVGVAGAGIMVAAIGFWDDHRHVPAGWRLLTHFTAASWLLGWLAFQGLPPQPWGILTPVVYAGAAVLIAWVINLYNFMDGIDGLAAVEAITSAGGIALIATLSGSPNIVAPHLLLAAAVAGFLIWNWHPARIFMGDVGSGFLGVVLAGLATWTGVVNSAFLISWSILLGVFVVDSGITLARRALRGNRVYEAHRMHAYQHAARQIGSHAPVTVGVVAINVFWLLPIAVLASLKYIGALQACMLAYFPLVLLALWWRAGLPEEVGVSPEPSIRQS